MVKTSGHYLLFCKIRICTNLLIFFLAVSLHLLPVFLTLIPSIVQILLLIKQVVGPRPAAVVTLPEACRHCSSNTASLVSPDASSRHSSLESRDEVLAKVAPATPTDDSPRRVWEFCRFLAFVAVVSVPGIGAIFPVMLIGKQTFRVTNISPAPPKKGKQDDEYSYT